MADEVIKTVLTADSAELRREFDRASAKVQSYATNTRRQLDRATGGLNKHSQGLLQVAQLADDAQYGIRGVLNNIPGLVMGFGAGAGVAGAISLAVLAAAKLGPLLKNLYTDTDAPKIKAAADAVAARYREEIEGIRAVAREKEVAAGAADLTRDLATYAASELRIQDQRLKVITNQREQMELMRGLQDRLNAARGQSAAGTDEVTRAQEDLELARRAAKLANDEYDRIATDSANVKSAATARLAAAEEEIRRLERNIAGGKANLAGADQAEKDGLEGYGERRGRAQVQLARDNALLEQQKALVTAITAELKTAEGLSSAALGTLSAQIDAETRKKLALEAQIPVYKELATLQAKAAADAEIAAARVDANPQLAASQAALTRELESRKKLMDAEAESARNRAGFAAEIDALRLEASGQKEKAKALRDAVAMQSRAAALAKELNVTEEEALRLLKIKARLEKAAANGAGRTPAAASRIRRSSGISAGSGQWNVSRLQGPRGLRGSGLRETAAERAFRERPRTPAITPEKGLESRMLEELEGINGALQKLGLK